tara:strand:- start:4373 stop:4657 length:285 start_codon:yes stop_codon:yes gene_type:complete
MQEVKTNEVYTILTAAGEMVCRIVSKTDHEIVVSKPRMFVTQGEQAGFLPGVLMSGIREPEELILNNYELIMDTDPEIAKNYLQHVTGLVIATA